MSAGPAEVAEARTVLEDALRALRVLTGATAAVQGSELADVVAELTRLRLATDVALVEVTAEAIGRGEVFDSGAASPAAWIERSADEGAVNGRDARAVATVAAATREPTFAPVRAALLEHRFGVEPARVVVTEYAHIQRSLPWPMHADCLDGMIDLAGNAEQKDIRRLRTHLIARYAQTGQMDKEQATLARRRAMTAFHEDEDGMFTAQLRLDPAAHAIVAAVLAPLSAPQTGTDEHGVLERDERSPEQRRADALVELCSRYPGLSGAGVRLTSTTKAVITLSFDDLVRGTGCATTPTGETVSPAVARQMACDAGIIPIVLGGPGDEIDVGREERLATPAQITALRHRDKGCTYPGCRRPPTWCRAHHIIHWANGGRTDLANLALLCQHHHTVVHRMNLTADVDAGGVRWRIPGRRQVA